MTAAYLATHRLLVRHLLQHARARPAATAILDHHATSPVGWTWRELADTALAISSQLRQAGCQAGDRVGLLHRSDRYWVAGLTAIHLLGAIDVPIDISLPADAIAWRLNRAECRATLASADSRSVREALHRLPSSHTTVPLPPPANINVQAVDLSTLDTSLRLRDADELSTILFTSGTTAEPKGVMLSHGNLSSNAAAKLQAVPQPPDAIRLSTLPLSHAYARTCDLGTWLLAGGILGLTPPRELLETLPKLRPHFVNLVPSLIDRLFAAAESAPWNAVTGGRLRSVGCGGAALREQQFDRLVAAGVDVIHGYGTTETSPVICTTWSGAGRPGCVGPAAPGIEIRFDDESQLLCRGPNICLGYLDDPAATNARWRSGWWCTGDVAAREPDGQVRILGRLDETIVLPNARKIQPAPLEQQLCRSPAVRHAMLALVGEELTAVIDPVPEANISAASLREAFNELLASHPAWERPRAVRFFPRPLSYEDHDLNQKGTLRRAAIREHFPELFHSSKD